MNLRDLAACLRPFASLLTLLGIVGLSACGGGSGSPNNPYTPPATTPAPLTVLPGLARSPTPGSPQALTITGGTPPYRAFSSNSAVLPGRRDRRRRQDRAAPPIRSTPTRRWS